MVMLRENRLSPEEYLALDRFSLDRKYEYLDGHMYVIPGATAEHAEVTTNLIAILRGHLQGSCRVLSSDVRVQVAEGKYLYPDVSVTYHPEDRQRGVDVIRYPRLIAEVLSPNTEARDRGKKFRSYRACPSIQEYMLINTLYQDVEIYHRQEDTWVYRQFGAGQEIELLSLGLGFSIASLYKLTQVPEWEEELD